MTKPALPPSTVAPNRAPAEVRKVGIGEVLVDRGDCVLRTLLGSCVGLVLHDARREVGGLAHIMLPESNGVGTPAGKYADTAIPELVSRIEQAGGDLRRLTARVAGGANMFGSTGPMTIGDHNVAMVLKLLRELRIPVAGQHCGGRQGRRMALEIRTGRVTIDVVGESTIEI